MPKTLQQRIILSFLLLLIVGLADYFVSFEISAAAFYMIPIVVFSYQDSLRRSYSIFFAMLAWVVWMEIDYHTHPYSELKYLAINWFFRTALFLVTAIVANRFFRERDQRRIISEQKTQLEQANAQLNKFIGVAAHDIRNPVGSIQMMAELLLEDEHIPKDKKEFVALIHATAQHSLQILNDTLNISKIQSGVIELNTAETEYISFIKGIVLLNKQLAEKKKQTLSLETEIASVTLLFDKTRISQVMNNLITNAIKYSEHNKAIIVKISYSDETHSSILTEVIDHGLGIDQKDYATLFDPFTTTSNKPTNNESKTGLGLAIAKKIVELHEGKIGFRSEKGIGSDFYFTLPV